MKCAETWTPVCDANHNTHPSLCDLQQCHMHQKLKVKDLGACRGITVFPYITIPYHYADI